MKKLGIKKVSGGKTFALFLAAQGFSNFGDALRFVAITLLLYKITGSGLSAGLGVFYSLIPGILLSPLAGNLGDILPPKYILVACELIRSAIITLFISINNTFTIYIFLMILSSLDTISNPALRKTAVSLIGKDRVLKGNSLLMGISGVTNILGSSLAAIITDFYGTEIIFLFNSILHALSAVLFIFIKDRNRVNKDISCGKTSRKTFSINLKGSLSYSNDIKRIKEILVTGTIVSFCIVSINMSFYPFAFDVLKVTNRGWGLIMCIFYMTNILAMIITMNLGKKLHSTGIRLVYVLLFIVSIIWFLYSGLNNFIIVLFLLLLEGILLSICVILLLSQIQQTVKMEHLAKVTGISDFINNIGKLAGTGYAYFLIKSLSVKYVFATNSVLILFYILYRYLTGTF